MWPGPRPEYIYTLAGRHVTRRRLLQISTLALSCAHALSLWNTLRPSDRFPISQSSALQKVRRGRKNWPHRLLFRSFHLERSGFPHPRGNPRRTWRYLSSVDSRKSFFAAWLECLIRVADFCGNKPLMYGATRKDDSKRSTLFTFYLNCQNVLDHKGCSTSANNNKRSTIVKIYLIQNSKTKFDSIKYFLHP